MGTLEGVGRLPGHPPAPRPLTAATRAARDRWLLVLLVALCFAALAVLAGRGLTLIADVPLLRGAYVGGEPGRLRVALVLTDLGRGDVVVPFGLAIAWVLWRRRGRAEAIGYFLVALLGSVASNLVKWPIGRPRPDVVARLAGAGNPSYPSGHSATSMLVFGLGGILLGEVVGGRRGRLVAFAGLMLAAMVGWSRVALGVHWPTDVAGAWLLAAAFALGWRALPRDEEA